MLLQDVRSVMIVSATNARMIQYNFAMTAIMESNVPFAEKSDIQTVTKSICIRVAYAPIPLVWTAVLFQDVQSAKIVSATNARIQFDVPFVKSQPVPTARTPTLFNPVAFALNLP